MTLTDKVQALAEAARWKDKPHRENIYVRVGGQYGCGKLRKTVIISSHTKAACREYGGILRGVLWKMDQGNLDYNYSHEAKLTHTAAIRRIWRETLKGTSP